MNKDVTQKKRNLFLDGSASFIDTTKSYIGFSPGDILMSLVCPMIKNRKN